MCHKSLLSKMLWKPHFPLLGADTRGSWRGLRLPSPSPPFWGGAVIMELLGQQWDWRTHSQLGTDERPICGPSLTARAGSGGWSVTQIPSCFGKITLVKQFPGRIWGNSSSEDCTDSPVSILKPGTLSGHSLPLLDSPEGPPLASFLGLRGADKTFQMWLLTFCPRPTLCSQELSPLRTFSTSYSLLQLS